MIELYKNCPTLDLHGLDRDYAEILVNDFIRDQVKLKKEKIIIVHGNGTGIIKKTVQEVLKKNKMVKEFKIDHFNSGMTIVTLVKNVDKQN